MSKIGIIDSHTAGEPTRVVISGAPDLGTGSPAEKLVLLRDHYDWFRSAVVNEPRGSDALVGALLCEPTEPDCVTGVIYFDNVTYLNMCGHGTIGLVATLAHMGRIGPGTHRIQTPIGVVSTDLHLDGSVTIHNVPAYRYAHKVNLDVPGVGSVVGEIAWGGNWFFICEDHAQELRFERIEALTDFSWRIRLALDASGITGANGGIVDHIILLTRDEHGAAAGKNFVLCPGKAYDRSPCGTGTSATLACLAADGSLQPGDIWVQESIIGSNFQASYTLENGQIKPHITGEAFVTLEGHLLLKEGDPFRVGIGYDL
jgi:4-hydroxyproline epimerase